MTAISVTFQGDNWNDVRLQLYYALGLDPAQTSTLPVDFPEYQDTEGSVEVEEGPGPGEITVVAEPVPAPRSHKKSRAPLKAVEPEPIPEPEPVPEPAPVPARELPPTEVLKAIVTQAVRLAQKKEGPAKILELLPAFKAKTGLGFVMEAEDKHRDALADLIEAAGLAAA